VDCGAGTLAEQAVRPLEARTGLKYLRRGSHAKGGKHTYFPEQSKSGLFAQHVKLADIPVSVHSRR
jgi:hypothetical protein